MRRRTKVAIAAALVVGGALAAVVLGVVAATETEWGRRRLATVIEAQVNQRLAPGVQVRIGRLGGGLGGAWSAESVSLVDSAGRTVVSMARASATISVRALTGGDVRLGTVMIEGVRAFLEQGADRSWNVSRLVRPSSGGRPRGGGGSSVFADSVVLRDGRVEMLALDTNPALPKVRRMFSAITAHLGPTALASRDSGGGWAPLRQMAMAIDNPPVTLVSAAGTARWWNDSLRFDVPALRLPASRASVRGVLAWPANQTLRVALDIRADTVSVPEVRWMSTLFPTDGVASATIAVRSAPGGALRYDVRAFELSALESSVSGSLSITPGRHTEVRDLVLDFRPLDLALVRNVFGDTILKPAWRGAITARVAGRGGRLDSLRIDSVAARYDDARVRGAQSWLSASGTVDASGTVTRLVGMALRIDSLDVRTLGAVAKLADSLHGVLGGRVTLDGPTDDVAFHDLWLQHVDGARARSTVSGSGRIASDLRSRWLDATLALDTVAVATLFRDRTTLPLQGSAHGTLVMSAVGDTLTLDATVRSGAARAHVAGTTLLDSIRTAMTLSGTIADFDPRAFIARREIPATLVSGRIGLSIDDGPAQVDRHVAVQLDSSSRVGESRVQSGIVRFGVDSTGFHLDTADIRADRWSVEAGGRLARRGNATDSVSFSATFDSLGVLRTLILDSTGAPRFEQFEGRLRASNGVVRGSFESAELYADLGAERVRVGSTGMRLGTASVALRDLPDRATGLVRGTVDSLASGAWGMDLVSVDATFDRGERIRVAAMASRGDTILLSAGADVSWPDDGFRIGVDSLVAAVGEHRWRLASPARAHMTSNGAQVDSLVFRSDHGATATLAGSFPDRGDVDASLRIDALGFEELAFLGLLPSDVSGRIGAAARVTGTRDAPIITASATLDSIRSAERDRPAVAFGGTYAGRMATVALTATIGVRRVLEAGGDIPLDLSFRDVPDRIIDAPMSLRLRADSVTLADFEALAPGVTGLGGSVQGAVDVQGSLRHPTGRGTLTLREGTFDLPKLGLVGRDAAFDLVLAGDSVQVRRLRLTDGDSPRDSAWVDGVVRLAGARWSDWRVDLRTEASRFRLIDDPRLAVAEAQWKLAVQGPLREPAVSGTIRLPYGLFTIGTQRRARTPRRAALAAERMGIPRVDGVVVSLGSDVRLRSRDANVQLEGDVELFGPLDRPWISGLVSATRGTYRVDLGLIKRTFRVDSGVVILEGTPEIPAALDIWTSYTVRRADEDDIHVTAHLYGTSGRPRLDLSSDLGSAAGQSEIISYLVFGKPSFGVSADRQSTVRTATAALVPSLGGVLEGVLGTVLPFFNTLQVTTLTGDATQSVIQSPVEGLLNAFAVTAGRQIGTDAFFSASGGVCRSAQVSSTSSAPFWLGTAAEYRPKRTVGAAISIDPGPAPCSRAGSLADTYQIGVDLSYEWKFGVPKKR